MYRTITHIDCFAGPGGICTGFHAAGIQTILAIEYIKSCCDTYKANHPDVEVINSDIRNVTAKQILQFIPKDGVDLVTSGMPCETFSTAGNTSRSFYDDRQVLYREGIRIAKISNAKMILFENVPAITSKRISKDSPILIVDQIKSELSLAGYSNMIEVILDATKFGVPQKRNRFFILACRFPGWNLIAPTNYMSKSVVKDALAGLPIVIANSGVEGREYTNEESAYSRLMRNDTFWKRETFSTNEITNHKPMKHRGCTLARFAILKQGESLKSLFDRFVGEERLKLQEQKILPKKMFIKRNYRLKPNEQCPTVTSHCLDEFVHPEYDRALTVRECARLQSFPDSYNFVGGPYIVPHIDRTVQDKYEQIGDAVPPLLAYAWGMTINKIFSCNEVSEKSNTMENYFDFCLKAYEYEYKKCFDLLMKSKRRPVSDKVREDIDKEAQKSAIRVSIIRSLEKFRDAPVKELWADIYRVHLFKKSGISDMDVISRVISADQSWKKSSGHAFEEMIKELATLALDNQDIEIVLQRDLNTLIKAGELNNQPRDISWLKEQIDGNIFDLFCILKKGERKLCFGCVQAKTSIRDRVTRDREPSLHAMQSYFWSVVFVLDGDFLALPKFQAMVNGGSSEFPTNGWHGMYVISAHHQNDRIYPLGIDFETFANHAKKAAQYWAEQRQWFNEDWRADASK